MASLKLLKNYHKFFNPETKIYCFIIKNVKIFLIYLRVIFNAIWNQIFMIMNIFLKVLEAKRGGILFFASDSAFASRFFSLFRFRLRFRPPKNAIASNRFQLEALITSQDKQTCNKTLRIYWYETRSAIVSSFICQHHPTSNFIFTVSIQTAWRTAEAGRKTFGWSLHI